MFKKISIVIAAMFIILISACTQKYDGIGPGITDASQQMSEKMILFKQVFRADTVKQPKIVISEQYMYAGRQLGALPSDNIISSWFFTDFTIPARDSLLDSVNFFYPINNLPDTLNLPYFTVSKINNKWNAYDDSLVENSPIDTSYFKTVQVQKNPTEQFLRSTYLLKFSVDTATFNEWRNKQSLADSVDGKFWGLSFNTNADQWLKFYSNTFSTSLPLDQNFRPRFICWYHKKDSASVKYSTKLPLRLSASLVKRKPVLNLDSTMIKIGGVGGEGMLFKINVQDSIPEKAKIIRARFVLKKVDQDPVNGGLSYLKIYNLNDSNNVWQDSSAQTVVNKKLWDQPGTDGGYSYTFSADSNTVYLTDINSLIHKWRSKDKTGKFKNFGFYLKAGEGTSGNRLGYSIFRDAAFEITYILPNDQ